MGKVKREDFGINLNDMPEEQKKFMGNILDMMVNVVNKANEGTLSSDEVETQFKGINSKLESYDSEKFAQLIKDNEDLCAQVKSLGESIDKLKKKGFDVNANSKFDEKFEEMYNSEKFQQFLSGTSKDARGFAFNMKDVNLTNNVNAGGTVTMTQQTDRVVNRAGSKPVHVRDFVTALNGDPEYPMMVWQEIYDVDRTARYVSENGMLPETTFKIKETTSEVKRIGNYVRISKRMLKSKVYVRSYILNMLPEGVKLAEDFGVIFGDGTGDNLKGITKYDGCKSVEAIVGETVVKGEAGCVKAVTQASNGIMIELASPYDALLEGMQITFKGAVTNTSINATFPVIKAGDTLLFLEGAAWTGDETATAKITFTANNAAFKSVETPNSVDALETAVAVMTYAQYAPTVMVLNPITVNSIRTEKDTTGNRLKLVEGFGGSIRIGGIPVVQYTGIPAGKYFLGDFNNGANIVDYSSLTLDWADDVDTKLKNQVVLYAQEELIMPVYNPFAFAYGSISSLKTAITKA